MTLCVFVGVIPDGANPTITPTVELNSLAMKLSVPALYYPLEPPHHHPPPRYFPPPPHFDFRHLYAPR